MDDLHYLIQLQPDQIETNVALADNARSIFLGLPLHNSTFIANLHGLLDPNLFSLLRVLQTIFRAKVEEIEIPPLTGYQTELARTESERRLRMRAESQALTKDAQYMNALEELHKYKSGTFSFTDALLEIKYYKSQVLLRDKHVAYLTSKINSFDEQISKFEPGVISPNLFRHEYVPSGETSYVLNRDIDTFSEPKVACDIHLMEEQDIYSGLCTPAIVADVDCIANVQHTTKAGDNRVNLQGYPLDTTHLQAELSVLHQLLDQTKEEHQLASNTILEIVFEVTFLQSVLQHFYDEIRFETEICQPYFERRAHISSDEELIFLHQKFNDVISDNRKLRSRYIQFQTSLCSFEKKISGFLHLEEMVGQF